MVFYANIIKFEHYTSHDGEILYNHILAEFLHEVRLSTFV